MFMMRVSTRSCVHCALFLLLFGSRYGMAFGSEVGFPYRDYSTPTGSWDDAEARINGVINLIKH